MGHHHRRCGAGQLAPAGSESTDAWADFLDGLKGRGLGPPLLAIIDAAPGLLSALKQVFSRSLRQKYLIHRARNVLAKVPAKSQTELKNAYWKLFDVDDVLDGNDGPQLSPVRSSSRSCRPGSRCSPPPTAAVTRPR